MDNIFDFNEKKRTTKKIGQERTETYSLDIEETEFKPYEKPDLYSLKRISDVIVPDFGANKNQIAIMNFPLFQISTLLTSIYTPLDLEKKIYEPSEPIMFGSPEIYNMALKEKIDSVVPIKLIDFSKDNVYEFNFITDFNFNYNDRYSYGNNEIPAFKTRDTPISTNTALSNELRWISLFNYILSFSIGSQKKEKKSCKMLIPGKNGMEDEFFKGTSAERSKNLKITQGLGTNDTILITRKPLFIRESGKKGYYHNGDHLKSDSEWMRYFNLCQFHRLCKKNWPKKKIYKTVSEENEIPLYITKIEYEPLSMFNIDHSEVFDIKNLLQYYYDTISSELYTHFELFVYTLVLTADVIITQDTNDEGISEPILEDTNVSPRFKKMIGNGVKLYESDIDWEEIIGILTGISKKFKIEECSAVYDLWNTTHTVLKEMSRKYADFKIPQGYSFNTEKSLIVKDYQFNLDGNRININGVFINFSSLDIGEKIKLILRKSIGSFMGTIVYNLFLFFQNSPLRVFPQLNQLMMELFLYEKLK